MLRLLKKGDILLFGDSKIKPAGQKNSVNQCKSVSFARPNNEGQRKSSQLYKRAISYCLPCVVPQGRRGVFLSADKSVYFAQLKRRRRF